MSATGKTAKRDRYLNALRQAGRRITEQRYWVCDYLAATSSHPTPYEVYRQLSARNPEISRATVYNTLNTLRDLGAIVEIGFGAEHTHYDTDTSPHVNLICLRCHSIQDHPVPEELGQVAASVGNNHFAPVAVRIDVYGFCRECQARKRAEIRDLWHARRAADSQA